MKGLYIMNTIKYRDLQNLYLNNKDARALAKEIFGDRQPSIYQTGFYSSPSWNWGYQIGLVREADNKIYEVVTRFGCVEAARKIWL